jgi:hypothetical protein
MRSHNGVRPHYAGRPRQLGQQAVLPLPSDPDEHLPAVEPPAESPEDSEDEEA